MFEEFDFNILKDPAFKEDSVREELIVPILKRLGYTATGQNRIIRSKTLKHPHVMIGSTKRGVITPDYVLNVGERHGLVLDAKGPSEKIHKSKHVEQVYSYAIHPDINVFLYALCNGNELIIFKINEAEPILRLNLREIDQNWQQVVDTMSPDAVLRSLKEPPSEIEVLLATATRWIEVQPAQMTLLLLEDTVAHEQYSSLASSQKAKIMSLAARCGLFEGNFNYAASRWQAAFDLAPDQVSNRSNLAAAMLLNDRCDEALAIAAKVLMDAPQEDNSAGHLMLSLHRLGKDKEIDTFVSENPWVTKSAHCLAILSEIRVQQMRFGDALYYAKSALRIEKINIHAIKALYKTLFNPISIKARDTALLNREGKNRYNLLRAEAALNRGLRVLEDKPDRYTRQELLLCRSTVRSVRGFAWEAISDCDLVLEDSAPEDVRDHALFNKASYLLGLDKYREAVPLLEAITTATWKADARLALATCYLHVDRLEEAAKILEDLWQHADCSIEQFHIASLLLSVRRADHDYRGIDSILKHLEATCPGHPETEALVAMDSYHRGKVQLAFEKLRAAVEAQTGASRVLLLLRLGRLYYKEEHFHDAVSTWTEAGHENLVCDDLDAFVHALYETQQLASALELAQQRQEHQPFNPQISRVEAAILAYMGMHREARAICIKLAEAQPSDYWHSIRIAQMSLLLEEPEIAEEALKHARYHKVRDDVSALIEVAKMQSILQLPDAIRYAFRARQIDFWNPATHHLYVDIFIRMTQKLSELDVRGSKYLSTTEILQLNTPQFGDVPSTVILKRQVDEKTVEELGITITNDGPFDHTIGFYSGRDHFAQKILESTQGDYITLPSSTDQKYEVDRVSNHFVHAFQQSRDNSTQWFGHLSAIRLVDVSGTAEEFWDQVASENRNLAEALSMYLEWKLPLCSVALAGNRENVDVWLWVSAQRKYGIHGMFSSSAEYLTGLKVLEALDSAPKLVLDFTSLMALITWDVNLHVPQYFKLLAPESLRREVRALLEEERQSLATGIVGMIGDKRFAYEITDEIRQSRIDFLTRLLNYLQEKAETLPTKAIIKFPPSQVRDWRGVLGQTTTDSILLSYEHGAPLYTDDAVLGKVAQSMMPVKSVSSSHVLNIMHHQGHLEKSALYEIIENMSLSNYRHMFLTIDYFRWLLDRHDNRTNATVRANFRYLEGPACNENSALVFCARIIHYVWQNSKGDRRRFDILNLCLETLCTGHPARESIAWLERLLSSTLFKYPLALEDFLEVQQYIHRWRTGARI